jgi:hypothetical protein
MTLQPLSMIRKYLIITVCSGFIAACGGGGGSSSTPTTANAGGSGNTANATSTSTVSLTPSKNQTEVNNYVTLTWSSQNATSCTASGNWNGTKSLSGSEDIHVTEEKTYTYTLTCSGASASVNVAVYDPETEGTCTNPHTAEFDKKFMGDFTIPTPYNTVPSDAIKAVGLKDYGVRWIYGNYDTHTNESWLNRCTKNQYTNLMYRLTLRRLKQHGVEQVAVYNYGYWENANASQWKLSHSTKHVTDYDLEYIVDTARDLGMKVHYAWQFLPLDRNNNFLFPFDGQVYVDMPLLEKILDAHEENMLWQADYAQKIGISSISVDWSAMWLCFCGTDNTIKYDDPRQKEMKNYYMLRMSNLIDKVKQVFDGDIYMGEGPMWNDSRVVEKADYIYLNFSNLLSEQDNKNLNVDIVTERVQDNLEKQYYNWYCLDDQPCGDYYSNIQVPWVLNLFAQSTRNFLVSGWVEDGFCTDGCMQYDVDVNFSAQAIYIEGMMRGAYLQTLWDIKGTSVSTGYWLSDSLQPAAYQTRQRTVEGFPNISQSIRGKPAEKILKYWYTGEYEQYYPKFK